MQRKLTKLLVSLRICIRSDMERCSKRSTECKQINNYHDDIEPRQADREPLRNRKIL